MSDDSLAVIEQGLRHHPQGISAQQLLGSLSSPMPLRTLQYRLQRLVKAGRAIREGVGRAALYPAQGAITISESGAVVRAAG